MNYKITSSHTDYWNDDFLGMCFMPPGGARLYSLSKRKLLRYFSELKTLNAIHTIILDNLSKINQVNYYMATNTLVLIMNKDTLEIPVPLQIFEDILINSTIKQLS